MFYKSNYIYFEATAGISHWEDFWIIGIPENFRITRKSFDSVQNTFIIKCLVFIFSNVSGLRLKSLLRNKHLLKYIFNYFESTFFIKKHVKPTKMVW